MICFILLLLCIASEGEKYLSHLSGDSGYQLVPKFKIEWNCPMNEEHDTQKHYNMHTNTINVAKCCAH